VRSKTIEWQVVSERRLNSIRYFVLKEILSQGFVQWAMMQVEAYAEIFRRQVYGIAEQDQRVVMEAVDITMSSASQLKEVGLDLTFFLRNLLQVDGAEVPPPGEYLRKKTKALLKSSPHFFSRSCAHPHARRRP
jgi:hypothetical protein